MFHQHDTLATAGEPFSSGNDALDRDSELLAKLISRRSLLHPRLISSRIRHVTMRLPRFWSIIVRVARVHRIRTKGDGPPR
jgi:hypothetical protein